MTAAINLLLAVRSILVSCVILGLIAQTDRDVQERSDYLVEKGRYSNYDYGYSVRIPKKFTGFRSPSPFPNHGFLIQLSDDPKAGISVDAATMPLSGAPSMM